MEKEGFVGEVGHCFGDPDAVEAVTFGFLACCFGDGGGVAGGEILAHFLGIELEETDSAVVEFPIVGQ